MYLSQPNAKTLYVQTVRLTGKLTLAGKAYLYGGLTDEVEQLLQVTPMRPCPIELATIWTTSKVSVMVGDELRNSWNSSINGAGLPPTVMVTRHLVKRVGENMRQAKRSSYESSRQV